MSLMKDETRVKHINKFNNRTMMKLQKHVLKLRTKWIQLPSHLGRPLNQKAIVGVLSRDVVDN